MIFRGEEEVMLLHSWPDLKAITKKSSNKPWSDFTPVFRLLRQANDGSFNSIGPTNLSIRSLDPEFEKLRAFMEFRRAIPPDIAKAVEKLGNRQWQLLRLCQVRPKSVDLLNQNPALGYCLAHHEHFRVSVGDGLERAAEISRMKQRAILRWLGFPDSKACAKILAKIVPSAVTLPGLEALRGQLPDKELQTRLGHLGIINAVVIKTAQHPTIRRRVGPSLLNELAELQDSANTPRVAPMLEDICRLEPILGREPKPVEFRSIAQIIAHHETVTDEFIRFQKDLEERNQFPPPPIGGNAHIVPLTNAEELIREGREQHNCVGSYADKVRTKQVYIYRILCPERATLAIEPGPDGNWEIQQLYVACNKPVKDETTSAVCTWLAESSLGIS